MFKNWNTKKTILTVVVLAILALVAYEMKWFGNTTTFFNLRGDDAVGEDGTGKQIGCRNLNGIPCCRPNTIRYNSKTGQNECV